MSQSFDVVIVGAGGIGGFGVQIAAALGATVVAVDVSDERLALAAEINRRVARAAAVVAPAPEADEPALREHQN